MYEESSDDTYTKCFDTSDTYPAVSSYKGNNLFYYVYTLSYTIS